MEIDIEENPLEWEDALGIENRKRNEKKAKEEKTFMFNV